MTLASGSFPVHDPQFWIVTLAALGAAAWLFARAAPWRWFRKKPRPAPRRATLTVKGRAVEARSPADSSRGKCH